jgi:hypothetical protein
MDLLVSIDPTEISDIDSPRTAQDTPGPSKTKKAKTTKKTKEVQDVDNLSIRIASITLDEEGDDEEGTKNEQQKVNVPLPRDEEDSLKNRKVSPSKSSSRKKPRSLVTKLQTSLMLADFDFIFAAVNDA